MKKGDGLDPTSKITPLRVVVSLAFAILILISFIFGMLFMLRCAFADDDPDIGAYGDFLYIIVGENSRFQDTEDESVAIIGFTNEGLEKEVLDIPREINGKPVHYIGLRDEGFLRSYDSYHVYSENLRKIYIHDNIKEIAYFYGSEVDVMCCSYDFDVKSEGEVFVKKIYVYAETYAENTYSDEFAPANIVFMNNYSSEVNGGYYRLDNVAYGEKVHIPPAPEREGYMFGGWHKEPECISEWDFETDTLPEEKTEINEDGEEEMIYQETVLYAKWTADKSE